MANREALVKSWQAQAMKLRQDQATQAREEAEAAKRGIFATVEPIQKELDINVKLSQDLERSAKRQALLVERLEGQKNGLLESSLLTPALSLTLREQRQALPSLIQYRRDSRKRHLELSEVGEAMVDVENRLRALTPIDAEADRILRTLGLLSPLDADLAKAKIQTLLLDRRELIVPTKNSSPAS